MILPMIVGALGGVIAILVVLLVAGHRPSIFPTTNVLVHFPTVGLMVPASSFDGTRMRGSVSFVLDQNVAGNFQNAPIILLTPDGILDLGCTIEPAVQKAIGSTWNLELHWEYEPKNWFYENTEQTHDKEEAAYPIY